MKNVIAKIEAAGNQNILLTERGSSFGYNTLVTDMRGLAIMRELGYPVVMEGDQQRRPEPVCASHGKSCGGDRH